MTETVEVPRALLIEVLRTASSDSAQCEHEYAVGDKEHAKCTAEREKIDQLLIMIGETP